jgi:hypothetical protein
MSGLEAICPQCGDRSYGWALSNHRNQWCTHCGCGLEISRDGVFMGMGYSPFTAPEYKFNASQETKLHTDKQGNEVFFYSLS